MKIIGALVEEAFRPIDLWAPPRLKTNEETFNDPLRVLATAKQRSALRHLELFGI